jgi:L-cysteine/cystine lyase
MPSSATQDALAPHRQQFPALAHTYYFNYGGQGVLPATAITRIQQAHTQMQEWGPFSNRVNRWIGEQAQQIRGAIARELQVSPDTVTLTEDVTVGCNIVLWGIQWREGDHLLLSDCEHPGIVAAAEELRARFGIKVSTCPLMATLNEGDPAAVIAQHLRPTTRLVVISHILWNTGQVLPLAAINQVCHSFPAACGPVRVLVDAAQSVGVLPLHMTEMGVDFYAFTGHKWLCGPAGLGGLYVSPEAFPDLRPTFIGWRGITKDDRGHPTGWLSTGERFEVATSDFTLYGALGEAIALHNQWGTATERYQRICTVSHCLWERLQALPQITCLRTAPPEAGLVSFQVNGFSPGTHKTLVHILEEQNFLLRTILDPDCIRACVHYLTTELEIDQFITALKNALK